MRKLFVISALLVCNLSMAQAGESWQTVFEDASLSVAIDFASIRREKQIAMFRERQVMRKHELDQASMRRIQEVLYRRQADCSGRMLSELSRAVFSDQGVMIHYEARRPAQVKWEAPQTSRDARLIESVCGPV